MVFDGLRFVCDIAFRRHLRSASPRHNLSTYMAVRLFSVAGPFVSNSQVTHYTVNLIISTQSNVAGPAAWNSLCDELRERSRAADSFSSDSYLKLLCLQSTRAYSALARYALYKSPYLLTYFGLRRLCPSRWANCPSQSVLLVSKISNLGLCDPDPPTLQTA